MENDGARNSVTFVKFKCFFMFQQASSYTFSQTLACVKILSIPKLNPPINEAENRGEAKLTSLLNRFLLQNNLSIENCQENETMYRIS